MLLPPLSITTAMGIGFIISLLKGCLQPPVLETYKPIYTSARVVHQKCKTDHVIFLLKRLQLLPVVHILKFGLHGRTWKVPWPALEALQLHLPWVSYPCSCSRRAPLVGLSTGFHLLFLCDWDPGYSLFLKYLYFLYDTVCLQNCFLGNLG